MPNSLHNKRQALLAETNPEEYNKTYYLIYDKDNVLDARWHGNVFRYFNHSCDPNCRAVKKHVYGVQIIMIETTRHLAEGEECTLFYSHLKPTPCHCTHCLPPHPHTPAHIALNPLTPLHTALNPHHPGLHPPNDISRTVILDDDIEDDDIELFDRNAVLKSVSNKRTKYLLSSFPSLGRVFPTALIVFLAFASTILPHDTTTMMMTGHYTQPTGSTHQAAQVATPATAHHRPPLNHP